MRALETHLSQCYHCWARSVCLSRDGSSNKHQGGFVSKVFDLCQGVGEDQAAPSAPQNRAAESGRDEVNVQLVRPFSHMMRQHDTSCANEVDCCLEAALTSCCVIDLSRRCHGLRHKAVLTLHPQTSIGAGWGADDSLVTVCLETHICCTTLSPQVSTYQQSGNIPLLQKAFHLKQPIWSHK